jgi:hypothetical protein
MHGMSVAGRRGEVVWKGSFTGIGQQRTYDTWEVRFGLIVPFALGDAVHIWDIPQTKFGGPCKAIRLRPDLDFSRRVITEENGPGVFSGAIVLRFSRSEKTPYPFSPIPSRDSPIRHDSNQAAKRTRPNPAPMSEP